MLASAFLSALVNLFVLGALPFLLYFAHQKWRRQRGFIEVARRAGLQLGDGRYLFYSMACAAVAVLILVIWPPPLEPFLRPGSPQESFRSLGLSATSIVMALLYGVIKTGFTEELLFRGLIAGSLSRRLSLVWANIIQAAIFLLPHLLVLKVMPEMRNILPVIFVIALFVGWVRIKSGSIIGGWMIHASVNVAICLSVAIRTAT
jgi:membrane protease YdiL (CAAX protease family)